MKKRITKHILPLLLTVVLVLGTATPALAASSTATRVSLNQSNATMYLRSGTDPKLTLVASVTPSDYTGTISWSISGESGVVLLSSTQGSSVTVTAKKAGAATVSAKVNGSNGTQYTASCQITVINGDAVLLGESGTANDFISRIVLGNTLRMQDIYESLVKRFTSAGGVMQQAEISFPFVGNGNFGQLYTNDTQSTRVDNGYQDALSTLSDMFFVSEGEGDYIIYYTVADNSVILSGTITIRVEVTAKNISFTVDEMENYTFSENTRDGNAAEEMLNTNLSNYGSIRFGSVSAEDNVGTLYTDSTQARECLVKKGTIVDRFDVGKLYFVPSRQGVFRITYTAFSGSEGTGSALFSGTISISVGMDSMFITVNLNGTDPYTFSDSISNSGETAESLILNAINSAVGSGNWSYLTLELPSEESRQIGSLYETSGSTDVLPATTFISKSRLGRLYFKPSRVGIYEVAYNAYSSTSASSLVTSGTLRLVVPSIPYAQRDLTYMLSAGETLSLTDSAFEKWFQEKRGGNYILSHVVFDEYEESFGTFYHDSTVFVPYNSPDFYTEYTAGNRGNNVRLLSHVTYEAPQKSGFQAVKFTCYGNLPNRTNIVTSSGVLFIFVTAGNVPTVTYAITENSNVQLDQEDFLEPYRSVMGEAPEQPEYYIQLLGLPSVGRLFYDSTGSGKSTTRLTDSNLGSYNFYINYGNSRSNIRTLSYAPDARITTPVSVPYVAFSISGKQLFTGAINFRYGLEKNLTVSLSGYQFENADVNNGMSGNNAVQYVTFQQPSSGKLWLDYSNGRGIEVTPYMKFYTENTVEGGYPISSMCYIPKAGAVGTVPLYFTAYSRGGTIYQDTINIELTHKTDSDVFWDVNTDNVGKWAADSIDFANKWGLVKGTATTGQPTFTPGNTMQRCDLVLMLYRMAGSPPVTGIMLYSDVPAGAYYYDSVLWAYATNLMEGVVSDDLYDPTGDITRQDFARILYNFTRSMGLSTDSTTSLGEYQDLSQVAGYALDAMAWAVNMGYITSTSSTEKKLSPTATATRAEIATLLHRYLTY